MVTRALIDLFFTIPAWLVGLIPTFSLPTALGSTAIAGYLSTITTPIAALSNWLPTSHIASCLALIAAAIGVAIAIRIVRQVASYATLGGGAV